jgi:hypothetical protein
MRKWVCSTLFAMVIAVCAPFAYAIDVCERVVCRIADQYEGYGKAVTKFKAEMAFAFGERTTEAGRANGLLTESNGFRMANLFKASGLPIEVGWRHAQNV